MSKYNWQFDNDGIEEDEETLQYSVEYEPGIFGFVSDENSSGSEWMAQLSGPNLDLEWGTDMDSKLKGYDKTIKTVDKAYENYKKQKTHALNGISTTQILDGIRNGDFTNEDDLLVYLSECASHDYKCPDKCDDWALDFYDDYKGEIEDILKEKGVTLASKELIHISFTGIYAGQTYCGKEPLEGERKAHLGSWVDNPDLNVCPECLEIYKQADEE